MSKIKPKISIVMVDGSFREHAFAAEYFSKQDFPAGEYEIIWVEYYNKVHPEVAKFPNVKTRTLNRNDLYHSSYCFNAGIKEAAGEILVIPDADIMVEKGFLSTVWEEHAKNRELVMYFHRLCQAEEDRKEDDYTFEYIKRTCTYWVSNVENYGGCLSVRKEWLQKIGGYEQHRAFGSGNHGNGRDVFTRLKNLGLCVKWHPTQYLYHPWHPGSGGVGADKRRTQWQQRIIRYRATHFMTTAFEAMDGTFDSSHFLPPPPNGDPDL